MRSCELCWSFSKRPCVYLVHQCGPSQRSQDVWGTAQEGETSDLTDVSQTGTMCILVAHQGFLICQMPTALPLKHSRSKGVEEGGGKDKEKLGEKKD